MNALALNPMLTYGVIAAIAVAVLLLHLLHPRPARRAVSSTVLWEDVLRRRYRHRTPWRWLLSLLLCLIVALALALALARPGGLLPQQTKVVVVLDNGPSMAARTSDGASRWTHAVETARQLIQSSAVDVMLVDTMGQAPVNGFVPAAQALDALARFEVTAHGNARAPVLPESAVVEVHVISDGVARFAMPAGAIVHSVFEPAVNVAVTGLRARPLPTNPLRVEAFVQVYNASTEARRVRLSLRGRDGFALAQELQMNAGELIDATFDVSAFGSGVLAAAAATDADAFATDDIAFAMVAPHAVRDVLLVTEGNPRLADAVRSLDGVRLRVIAPQQWQESSRADVYLFDRFAPQQPPPGGALLFRPGAVSWLAAPQRAVQDVAVSDWVRDHRLLDGLAWQTLRVARASVMTELPDQAMALVSTGEGALIAAGSGERRWIVAGFSPEDSNFSLQPALPVFLGNALDFLSETESVIATGLGAVRVPLAQARIVDGSGQVLDSRTFAGETIFDASKPDVYTATAADARLRIVANVLDPRDADINVTRFDSLNRDAVRRTGYTRIEPWIALVAAALLFLLIEWTAWTRRLTA